MKKYFATMLGLFTTMIVLSATMMMPVNASTDNFYFSQAHSQDQL